eukprot:GEMP01012266.1.p1 GENE.GEMP01012266.1~~GEMP01012266.1.p1  ORF type:complete len:771 (+),score=170.02 GEMP01012266.1:125-2437(+)
MREIYVVCGPPASGKGTLAASIAKTRGLPKIGAGDLLRQAIAKGTDVGKVAQEMMLDGDFASDDIICQLIVERAKEEDCSKGFVLDGYPRTKSQARQLDDMLLENCDLVTAVIEMRVDDTSILEERVTGRWTHLASGRAFHIVYAPPKSYNAHEAPTADNMRDDETGEALMQRDDDTPETLKKRMRKYIDETAPVLDHYKSVLKRVDASKFPMEIVGDVQRTLESVMEVTDNPREILVESRNEQIEGAYLRLNTDASGYPQYRNVDVTSVDVLMFLWHDDASATWHFSRRLGHKPSPEDAAYCPSMRGATNSKNPTAIPVHQLRRANVIRIIPYGRTVFDFTKDRRSLFIDSEFPPDKTSLKDPDITQEVEWIRVDEIRTPLRSVLFGSTSGDQPKADADPLAALQGALGDCWLIDAFASMANRLGLIAEQFHLVSGLTLPSDGKISLRFFDVRVKRWVTVTIDTLIPCVKTKSGWYRPLYARLGNSNPPQCWPLLLEKAYAKFDSNNYYALTGGLASWAWQASTGVIEQWVFERNVIAQYTIWLKFAIDIKEQLANKKIRRATPFVRVKDDTPAENDWMFKEMELWDDKDYLMSCGIPASETEVEHKQRNGLVKGHAYSILGVFQFDEPKGGRSRLVQLRNPWGAHEWSGPWSDSSKEWKAHPKIREILQPSTEDDGVFYMAYKDWSKEFPYIFVSPSKYSQRVHPAPARSRNPILEERRARVLAFAKQDQGKQRGSSCCGGGGQGPPKSILKDIMKKDRLVGMEKMFC